MCVCLPEEERGSKDKYLRAAESLNQIAAKLRQNGFEFLYHNHDFEFREMYDGRYALDILMENTDPFLVGMELHIGWLPQLGIDMLGYIRKLGRRIKILHVHAFHVNPGDPPFDSAPAIALGRELDVGWAILENVYPVPLDIDRMRGDITSLRHMAQG